MPQYQRDLINGKLPYKPASLVSLGTLAAITRSNMQGYVADMNFVIGTDMSGGGMM